MTNKPVKHTHKKIDPVKRRNRKINNSLVISLCVLSIFIIVFFVFNIVTVAMKKEASGKNNSLSEETNKTLRNDQYEIGNNPTAIQKEYFQALTDAVKSSDNKKIAEEVVYNFVADYFTWTNKDGNYEVGGLQYIYADKYVMFQEEARYNFYSDLDLYISQYGRENLLEVDSVTTHDTRYGGDFDVNGKTYLSYYVDAEWTYKDSKSINVDDFQNKARFRLVDNTESGRYEIVEIIER